MQFFFDFDNDRDQDLLVLSGGNEFTEDSPHRKPRLYINHDNGRFVRAEEAFGEVFHTGSCIAPYDFDQDGWTDLFLGSLAVPWNYGELPKSYLLKNNSGKNFTDVSSKLPQEGKLGMITDAVWVNLSEEDQLKSLVLVGEWMEVTILKQAGEVFKATSIANSSGWWKSIDYIDYDGDGDQDLLVGNLGLNSKLKATPDSPLEMYFYDFDHNGKPDPIIAYMYQGNLKLASSRPMLEKQIPSLSRKYSDNMAYAKATVQELLGDELSNGATLSIRELRSGVFQNTEDGFMFEPFPALMQASCLQDFLKLDQKEEDAIKVLAVGNLFAASMNQGQYAASRGYVLSLGSNSIELIDNSTTGIFVPGDTRKVLRMNFGNEKLIAVACNNDSIKWFKRRAF